MKKKESTNFTRRDFMKTSAAAAAILSAYSSGLAAGPVAGSDKIRVGVIGFGGRGSGAAVNALTADKGVEIVSLCELFKDRMDESIDKVKKNKEVGSRFNVAPEKCFVGFDSYKKVIASDVDYVILATPPHFRPEHIKAAVEAGKHVFCEKPVAVDPVGIRAFIETAELAKKKGLSIVAGTQRRHQQHYLEAMKRIHDGDIGEIVSAQCYWNQEGLWLREPKAGAAPWSEMETQCRNWLYYSWLSGDHIVEQHVHNLDVVNWAIGAHPTQCLGMGGRQVRIQPQYGNIFDHFAVDYQYENGVRVMSMCRQMPKCGRRVSERIVGTKGVAFLDGSNGSIEGPKPYKFEGTETDPYVQEHIDLIAAMRAGKPVNEGVQVAESVMTAILGRMSTYTGQELKWAWAMNASKLRLGPEKCEFGPMPVDPVAVPGETPLI